MSAPILYVILPFVLSVVLFLVQERKALVARIAVGVSLFLAMAAFLQPIGSVLTIGTLSISFQESITFLGRALTLQNSDRFILLVIYLSAAFWFGGANTAQTPKMFIPVGLAISSLMVAALAVEPFIYAAVLLELAAILTIPLLLTRYQSAGAGILRFFIFQAIALPVILLAGWILGGSQASVSNETQLRDASILLGLGFSFWLAVIPFHPWVPLVMKESHPYSAGFLLCMQSVVFIVIIIDYLNGFIWLKDNTALYPILRTIGTFVVAAGGILAAFQQDARRLFGYLVIMVNGFALIVIGLNTAGVLNALYYKFLPQVVGLAIFALSLSIILKEYPDTDFIYLKGALKKNPFAIGAMMISILSLGGLPGFASFPSHMEILESLADTSITSLIWVIVGLGGLFFAAARLLANLIGEKEARWQITEKPSEIILLGLGTAAILVMGFFPQTVSSIMTRLLEIIPYLS